MGTDAVAALMRILNCDEAGAIKAGNHLIRADFMHHACHDHMLKNEKLFYKFTAVPSPTHRRPSSTPSEDVLTSPLSHIAHRPFCVCCELLACLVPGAWT